MPADRLVQAGEAPTATGGLEVRRVAGLLEGAEEAGDVLAEQALVVGIAQEICCVGHAGVRCRRRSLLRPRILIADPRRRQRRVVARTAGGASAPRSPGAPRPCCGWSGRHRLPARDRPSVSSAGVHAQLAGERHREVEVTRVDAQLARLRAAQRGSRRAARGRDRDRTSAPREAASSARMPASTEANASSRAERTAPRRPGARARAFARPPRAPSPSGSAASSAASARASRAGAARRSPSPRPQPRGRRVRARRRRRPRSPAGGRRAPCQSRTIVMAATAKPRMTSVSGIATSRIARPASSGFSAISPIAAAPILACA